MEKVRFGKTELMVSKIAFGGLPIQRVGIPEAVEIVRRAIDLGINFIDSANNYTDSEEKIGHAIKGIPRDRLVITTKSAAADKKTFLEHIDLSLKRLGTDYIDIYQHHLIMSRGNYNAIMGEDGAFEGMTEAIRAGKVRFPAFSCHSVSLGAEIMREGKFSAVQLPFNYVDDQALREAIPLAKELDMGFIAMKPLGGGMLGNAELSIKYLSQFESIVPDPGVEKISEIEEIVRIAESGEKLSEEEVLAIEKIREEMGSYWCHRCDYCMPCPQNIFISGALTVDSMIKRMPMKQLSVMAMQNMENARTCLECRDCVSRCPYNLNIPELLKEKLSIWDRFMAKN